MRQHSYHPTPNIAPMPQKHCSQRCSCPRPAGCSASCRHGRHSPHSPRTRRSPRCPLSCGRRMRSWRRTRRRRHLRPAWPTPLPSRSPAHELNMGMPCKSTIEQAREQRRPAHGHVVEVAHHCVHTPRSLVSLGALAPALCPQPPVSPAPGPHHAHALVVHRALLGVAERFERQLGLHEALLRVGRLVHVCGTQCCVVCIMWLV